MATNRKVVWSEGMLLTPQHFQHWDQHYEALLSDRLSVVTPFGWGVTTLDIDRDGLQNGRFTLLGLQGLMPDGLMVQIPDQDTPPQTRQIGEFFSPQMETLDVFVGIPVEREGVSNCRLEGGSGARPVRYTAEFDNQVDANSGENPREILVAKKNLKILFSGEETEDTTLLKIAELVWTPSGAIGLHESYIPPCLAISGSSQLMKLLRGLIELLVAKYNTFDNPVRGVLETVGMDLSKYTLVRLLSEYMPWLTHLNHVGKVHPEVLYMTVARLAGQLMILSEPGASKDIPAYDHENLALTFGELDTKVRMVIEGVTPTRYVSIPLESSDDNAWVGQVSEPQLFQSSQFYLMASGDLSEDQIRTLIPQHIKIGSPSKLREIVAAALPGVRLYHTPRPPTSLPVKIGNQFFRLDDRGVFWKEIQESHVVALHIPENLKSLSIQLLAAKE